MYLCCYTLITKNYKVYEIIYFWGLAGAIQAILLQILNITFLILNIYNFSLLTEESSFLFDI
ncbi:hypothetical protein CN514_16700 [Bacillus sp. AFS001701]|nr:hypothetical protein CN514_16700 [Bacillus sp. AFS001701]